MTAQEAEKLKVWFGQYQNMRIGDIAVTDDGLRYLDWLRNKGWIKAHEPVLKAAIDTYLADPEVAIDLAEALSNQ